MQSVKILIKSILTYLYLILNVVHPLSKVIASDTDFNARKNEVLLTFMFISMLMTKECDGNMYTLVFLYQSLTGLKS